MLADNLAKVTDFFVIQSDTGDGKQSACYLCLLSPGWKIGDSLEVKGIVCSLQLKWTLYTKVMPYLQELGGRRERERDKEWMMDSYKIT